MAEPILVDDDDDDGDKSTLNLNRSIEILDSPSPKRKQPENSSSVVSSSSWFSSGTMTADELLARQLQAEEQQSQLNFPEHDTAPYRPEPRFKSRRSRARHQDHRDARFYARARAPKQVNSSSWSTQSYRRAVYDAENRQYFDTAPATYTPGMGALPASLQHALMSDDLSNDQHYEALLSLDDSVKPKGLDQPDRYSILQRIKLEDLDKLRSPTCAICLGEFEVDDRVRRLPCLDMFHQQCIDRHFIRATDCPICRVNVKLGQQLSTR
jgi:hypothetical protein